MLCIIYVRNVMMKPTPIRRTGKHEAEQTSPSGAVYGYARVSTDGQSLDAQLAQLEAAGTSRIFQEKASGAQRNREQLGKLLDRLNAGDLVLVTRLDRLARSTRDLLNVLGTIADKGASFRSLGDGWADTTTAHGRLMLTVLAGLA